MLKMKYGPKYDIELALKFPTVEQSMTASDRAMHAVFQFLVSLFSDTRAGGNELGKDQHFATTCFIGVFYVCFCC